MSAGQLASGDRQVSEKKEVPNFSLKMKYFKI
jgi:hypothetical protein